MTRFQRYILLKIFYKREFINPPYNDPKKFAKYYTKTLMLLNNKDVLHFSFKNCKHLFSAEQFKQEYKSYLKANKIFRFRPLEVLKDKEEEQKRKYPINLFVKKFHMADVLNLQCDCEDLLNPYLDKIRNIIITKSTKKTMVKRARARYEEYKKSTENRLKQYSIPYVINLYLDYKFVDVEAYNAFFVKIRDPFMMSIYNLAKDTIHKRFSECEEVIKRCEKEFLNKRKVV